MKSFKSSLNHNLILFWIFAYFLSSVLFFAPVIINLSILKTISWTILFATFLLTIPALTKKKYIREPYGRIMLLLVFTVLISVITAFMQHYQGITYSIRVILNLLPISLFFFLRQNKISLIEIERLIWLFIGIYLVIYIIGFSMAPRVVFDNTGGQMDVNTQRGIARVLLLGTGFLYLGYFMTLNKWLLTKQKHYLLLGIIFFILIVMGVSRQHILFSFLLGLLMILNQLRWYAKLLITASVVILVTFAISHSQILQTLIELTKNQITASGTENVRIQAYNFFLFDYDTNIFQILFGNGIPHLDSPWGIKYHNLTKSTGFYPSDVGFAKIFFYWGLWGIFIVTILLFKVLKQDVPPSIRYAKYYFFLVILTNIASHSFFKFILPLSIVIYILSIGSANHKNFIKHAKHNENYLFPSE